MPLTNDYSRNGQEHKGIPYKESFHIVLCDVLHPPHGQLRPGPDPVSNLVKAISAPLWVLPIALSHLLTFFFKSKRCRDVSQMFRDENNDDVDSVLLSLGQTSSLAVSVLIERVEDVARS